MDIDHRQLANLMGMAGTAERGGNHEEALSYYNRVLEVDPTFSEAWLGKGRAAGWQSTLAHPRVNESLVAFGHAIATSGDEHRADTARRAHTDLVAIVGGVWALARAHFADHGAAAAAQQTYVATSGVLIDALATCAPWDVDDRAGHEQEVLICRNVLDYGVSEKYAAILRARLEAAIAAIARIDPAYPPPAAAAETFTAQRQRKADSDALGYVVAFVMIIILIFVMSYMRAQR